jgi:CheY-like chemotaxis protein
VQTFIDNKHPGQHRGRLMTTPVILCVDDESDVLDALQRVFIDEPYSVLRAQSGEEALELLKQSPAQLIIADYRWRRSSS